MLTNGINTGDYDAAVLSINADTAGARINFEKAQLRLLEFKSLIDECKRNHRKFPLLRDVGVEVVAVAAAAVDQEGGEAMVIHGVDDVPMAWHCAMLTPPISPSMSPQLVARP